MELYVIQNKHSLANSGYEIGKSLFLRKEYTFFSSAPAEVVFFFPPSILHLFLKTLSIYV